MSRTDAGGIDNLRGWLTTVVARVCLDMLRRRASRREDSLDTHVPDPIIRSIVRGGEGVEADAMLADSVGLALLVVFEKLEPAERLAFVLHDVFGMGLRDFYTHCRINPGRYRAREGAAGRLGPMRATEPESGASHE